MQRPALLAFRPWMGQPGTGQNRRAKWCRL